MRPEHEYADLGGSHLVLPGRGVLIAPARWGSPDLGIPRAEQRARRKPHRLVDCWVKPGKDEWETKQSAKLALGVKPYSPARGGAPC